MPKRGEVNLTSKLQKRLRKEDPKILEKYNAYQREYRRLNPEKTRKYDADYRKRVKLGYRLRGGKNDQHKLSTP